MKGCSAIGVAMIALSSSAFACDQGDEEPARFTAYPLKHVEAATIVKTLRTLLGNGDGVEFVSDEGTNTVLIRAQLEKFQQVKKILSRLDVGVPNSLTVVALKHAGAARVANQLKAILAVISLFGGDDRAILVTADERGNNIIISAGEQTMQLARMVLRSLDVKEN